MCVPGEPAVEHSATLKGGTNSDEKVWEKSGTSGGDDAPERTAKTPLMEVEPDEKKELGGMGKRNGPARRPEKGKNSFRKQS